VNGSIWHVRGNVFLRDKVEPVFLAKRAGHTRCVVCHTINNAPFHLVSLSAGAETWNEEQSRKNFELVQRVAAPGLLESPRLKHPLAQEAGGDPHHGGGQQFGSQQEPEWLILKAFVLGTTKQRRAMGLSPDELTEDQSAASWRPGASRRCESGSSVNPTIGSRSP
jgi:hypothetical protein